MSVLAISFSKYIVSPLEILQEGKEISSSNWDLCSPTQLWRTSVGVGCPVMLLLFHCPAALSHSHQPGNQCGSGALWQGSEQWWAWTQSSQARQDCWVIWHQGSQNQGGSRAARQMPGPWAACWGAVSGTASGGSSAGAASAASWGSVGQGLQRSASKEKGVKEDWADTPLEQQSRKAGRHGVKSSAFIPGGVGRAATKPM